MHSLSRLLVGLLAVTAVATAPYAHAQSADSLCARVVLQIDQQLTLEREGFEARLGISNGLPSSLDNFQVTLHFTDKDGNPVPVSTDSAPNSAGLFYYRVQSGFTVPTSVAPNTTQKAAYLIVPSPGAAGNSADGTLYYIGATVKYTSAGTPQTVEIAPDFITVRPMPQLELQYFLPGTVYGDDPLTPAIEPVVPFPLAVRVANHSAFAPAHQVAIQSGQPQIIDNQHGLLVDFKLLGCSVNNQPAQPTLLVNFGDIGTRRSSMAAWQMTASLTGTFVKFSAEVSHAPDLGGALTSLIPDDAISTHRLIGVVLVDLPGRDTVSDFLGCDNMTGDIANPKIYESDRDDVASPVDYFAPGDSNVSVGSGGNTVTVAPASAVMYARAVSPISADKLVSAVRSDGKTLPAQNVWISKTQDTPGHWQYWLNLFDTGRSAGQSYALTYTDAPQANRPPVLTVIGGPGFKAATGKLLTIGLSATDPDGTTPTITPGLLPDGATYTANGSSRGTFTWTPRADQLGSYAVTFRASDGSLTDVKTAAIDVLAVVTPTFKSWQQQHWPTTTDPNVIGSTADPDGDRMNNLLEYALNADPTVADDSMLPQLDTSTVDGKRYLTLSFLKRTNDADLVYEVVASDNLYAPLSSWTVQTQAETVDQTGVPDGFARVRIRDSVPIETGPAHRYLRLRVTDANAP